MSDINKVGQAVLTFDRVDCNSHNCVGFRGVRSRYRSIIVFYLTFLVPISRLCEEFYK